MPGLDPGIHRKKALSLKRMDCRVKPGNDRGWDSANTIGTGSLFSRRQQRAEAAGHDARADARGGVDQALAREPGLEFRRRAALQEIAHGERVVERRALIAEHDVVGAGHAHHEVDADRKSTRLNSSHSQISYAVFCLKKKTQTNT